MAASRVLLINLSATLCELARHLVHAGISLALHLGARASLITPEDVNENLFAKEEHVGQSFVELLSAHLQELNPFTKIVAASDADLFDDIDEFDAVVVGLLPDVSFPDILSLCQRTHSAGVPFYAMEGLGKYAAIFVDVGEEFPFEVEKPKTAPVELESADEENVSENLPKAPPAQMVEERVIEDSLAFD